MKKAEGFVSKIAKGGFYITLFLCITAIGVSGYVMYLAKDTAKKAESVTESSLELPFPSISEESYTFAGKVDIPEKKEEPKPEQKESVAQEEPKKQAAPKKEEAKPAPKKEIMYTMAVSGSIAEPFSETELTKSETLGDWRIHAGVDIACDLKTPVKAIADGSVAQVATDTMMGNVIRIKHENGLESIYANLDEGISIKVGDAVKSGDVIAQVGESALSECMEPPHLHLEVLKDGVNIDPLSLYPEGED